MVGGCVRDRLMGREAKDWDVEVYEVEPARLRALLDRMGRVNVVGEAFTVYKLGRDLDVSLPRRERKSGRGHRGFVIEGDPRMSVGEAARRRDFTVNAVLEDPLTGDLLDPFGGRADLERKLLRAVSPETFVEDSLRVLRAAQFAARFEFDIEPETVRLCRSIDLTDLPAERVWGELEKILLVAPRPSVGLRWLDRLGALEQLFPELAALKGVPQDPEWHPEGWSATELPFQPLGTGVAEAAGVNRRRSLREFLASPPADAAVIPTGDRAVDTQTEKAPADSLVAADGTRTDDFGPPTPLGPAAPAHAESLMWRFGSPAFQAHEVVRVVFEVPLDGMRSVVRAPVNDFEIVRGVVHPVAVFMMHVLPSFEPMAELRFHHDTVDTGRPVTPLEAGVHVPAVVVDARAATVNHHVLFDFYLALVRDGDFVHNDETVGRSFFQVEVGDVSYHTWLVCDRARELIDDLDYARRVTVMLAALCHDLGKPSTTEFVEGRIRSRGHEEAGVGPTLAFLDRLKIFTLEGYDVRAQTVALVRDHLKPGEFYRVRDEISDGAFRRLARRCELELLYRVAKADSLGRNAPWVPRERWYGSEAQDWFIARARELQVQRRPPAPVLMGRHLVEMGLQPSPLFKRVLDAVYEMQLDGRVRELGEAKEAARRLLAEAGLPDEKIP